MIAVVQTPTVLQTIQNEEAVFLALKAAKLKKNNNLKNIIMTAIVLTRNMPILMPTPCLPSASACQRRLQRQRRLRRRRHYPAHFGRRRHCLRQQAFKDTDFESLGVQCYSKGLLVTRRPPNIFLSKVLS